MKILVIGSGGREHAICCQFLKSSKVDKLYCAPGNGGTSRIATNVNIQVNDASCFCELVDFVKKNKIDFTFVGPEVPLSLGIVDYFKKNCLEIIGPSKNAAKLESSKIYSKEFMKKYNIPTAFYNCFFSVEYALDFLRNCNANEKIVVKADGLAAGKGVYICENKYEATNVIDKIMNHKILGSAGNDIIIEKYIKGIELSCLVFTDGMSYSIMPISHDYKKINDHDEGVNTGGMGAYAPVSMSIITDDLRKKIEIIIKKVINGINAENIDYNGVLYVGLIIKDFCPYVLEFNCRFGDPETQVILPLLNTDLVDICIAILNKKLSTLNINWKNRFSVSVVLTSNGYPGKFESGFEICGLENINNNNTIVFHSGTKFKLGKFFTCGGRVLSVTSTADNIKSAINNVYFDINNLYFENMYYRRDIARMELEH